MTKKTQSKTSKKDIQEIKTTASSQEQKNADQTISEQSAEQSGEAKVVNDAPNFDISKLPPEAQEKLKHLKEKLDTFAKKVVDQFDKYVVGITLIPPAKPRHHAPQAPPGPVQPQVSAAEVQPELTGEQMLVGQPIPPQMVAPIQPSISQGVPGQPGADPQQGLNPNDLHIIVLIDDSDSKKMTKYELKDKLSAIIINFAKEIDPLLKPEVIILTELWQSCYDAKYDIIQDIAMGAPIYDTGMLGAIKIAEIHKSMVIKKFEKYIVSYVLAGSLVRGQAKKTSDIDVFLVIDDTDVKKMTRAELKDKLRAIILSMGYEAGQMTGINNKINIQVYILTDFWDSLREANPIIFTLLRDGVPFYDRGIFMPWKQLLRIGKIKPSPEAIDMFMSSGEQMLKRVEFKLKEIGMEDIYYAILTPSQAAIMLYGMAPPAPRETAELLHDVFVKKEKMLEEKWVTILEKVLSVRKDIEHGTLKELKGAEIDVMLKEAEDYLKRIKELFDQIQKMKEESDVLQIYESLITIVRDALTMEGITEVATDNILPMFEKKLIHQGKLPEKYMRMFEEIVKAKKDYDKGKLTKSEIEKVKRDSRDVIKFVIEYIQLKRGRELERAKIRVKHGEKYGEVIMLDSIAFIIHDVDAQEKGISKADISKEGGLKNITSSTFEEMEQHIAKIKIPAKVFIKHQVFEDMKNIFGKDVEILVNY